MTYGLDTSFLVQLEVREVPGHRAAHAIKERLIGEEALLAVASQTLCEFLHVVTDPRRFSDPLRMDQALQRSEMWWNLKEVTQIDTDPSAVAIFHRWLRIHHLGRKRILDTMLAALFHSNGITRIVTSDPGGFFCFGCFEIIDPLGPASNR